MVEDVYKLVEHSWRLHKTLSLRFRLWLDCTIDWWAPVQIITIKSHTIKQGTSLCIWSVEEASFLSLSPQWRSVKYRRSTHASTKPLQARGVASDHPQNLHNVPGGMPKSSHWSVEISDYAVSWIRIWPLWCMRCLPQSMLARHVVLAAGIYELTAI